MTTSSTFEGCVRETPNIAESGRETDASQQKFHLGSPSLAGMTGCPSPMAMSGFVLLVLDRIPIGFIAAARDIVDSHIHAIHRLSVDRIRKENEENETVIIEIISHQTDFLFKQRIRLLSLAEINEPWHNQV